MVLVDLAGDEIFHIRVIHAQDCHVRAATRATLGDLTEGVVVHPQKANRSGGLPS
jgi:hypothetical protein